MLSRGWQIHWSQAEAEEGGELNFCISVEADASLCQYFGQAQMNK